MKHITTIASAIIFLASQASAEITGRMNCKVKSNKIIEIEEGVSAEYNGFTDQFIVGDTLALTYGVANNGIFVQIKDNVRDNRHFYTSIKIKEDVEVWTTEPGGAGIKDKFDRIYLSSDRVSITSLIFGDVKLVRYYKSDWQGIVVNARDGERQVHVFSLDCRHKNDELEKIFLYMGRFG